MNKQMKEGREGGREEEEKKREEKKREGGREEGRKGRKEGRWEGERKKGGKEGERDTKYHKPTVTVAKRPSGTLATMIPIRKTTASSQWYLRMKAMMKKETPRATATPVTM